MLRPMPIFRSKSAVLAELRVSHARDVILYYPAAGPSGAPSSPIVMAYANGREVTVSEPAVSELRDDGAQIGGSPEVGARSPLGE
jgi:hypothetical protein